MSECDEIDLSYDGIEVVSKNELFKQEVKKWLFGKDFNEIGNVLNEIDDMPEKLELFNENSGDYLCFNCVNKYKEPLFVYLLDGNNNKQRYLLILKNRNEDHEYRLDFVDDKIFIYGNKSNRIKKNIKMLAG